MGLFLSCYENRLDTKGRVSVPAAFRSSLTNENFAGVILFRSFTHNYIEEFRNELVDEVNEKFDNFTKESSNRKR